MLTVHNKLPENSYNFLEAMVNLLAPLERQLYADLNKGEETITELQTRYVNQYKIHKRYFNSILCDYHSRAKFVQEKRA